MRTLRTHSSPIPAAWGRQLVQAALCLGLVFTAVGCQSMGSAFKLKEAAGANNEDPWTTQAGSEGRAGRTLEKEADPLNLRRFLLSEKAMEIERNCGFE